MRRLPGILGGLAILVGLGAVGFAQLRVEQIRDRDCDQALALRDVSEQNDVDLVQDIADAVIARGGRVDQSLVDDIAERVDRRYDQFPPPADCDP